MIMVSLAGAEDVDLDSKCSKSLDFSEDGFELHSAELCSRSFILGGATQMMLDGSAPDQTSDCALRSVPTLADNPLWVHDAGQPFVVAPGSGDYMLAPPPMDLLVPLGDENSAYGNHLVMPVGGPPSLNRVPVAL